MDNELRWDQVRHFVAVARAGSVVGAARVLGVSHATVLRNVSRLESSLGVRLFDPMRSGYRITADGQEVLVSALGMEEHADTLVRRAMGKNPDPEGLLKLVVTDTSLFDPMPLLRDLRRAQPRIELTVEDAHGDAAHKLAQLHADAAIVLTNSPPEELVGRQLGRLHFAYFASAGYLGARAPAEIPPAECHWVVWHLEHSAEFDEAWQDSALRRLTRRPNVVLRTDRHADALAAVRSGVGASLLSEAAGDGLLRLPFPEPRETCGVWLLTHPDLRRSGRVRALFEFVADAAQGMGAGPAVTSKS